MPFVDLSSPVQNLQGSVDPNAVSPVQSTAQQPAAPVSTPQVQGPSNQPPQPIVEEKVEEANDTSIVDKLSEQSNDNNVAISNVDDGVKVSKGPEIPTTTIEMPPVVNSVNTNNQNNQDTQTGASPSSVTGAENLPPLNEIFSDNNNSSSNENINKTQSVPDQTINSPEQVEQQPVQPQNTNNMENNVIVDQIPPLNANANTNTEQVNTTPQVSQAEIKTPSEKDTGIQPVNFDFKSFDPKTATMEDFMSYTIAADASDLHLSAGNPTMIRVHGALREILGTIPNNARVEELIKQIISEENFKTLKKTRELDISYAHSSGNRFRVNVYMAQGEWASALRLIPQKIRTISELNLPDIIYDFTKIPQGLIIVAGPTGSGKSTTLASMLQEINLNRAEHILTIEDPIEYVYPKAKSRVDQRELGKDTLSWKNALRAALRQDPNVVLVGEMRDHETIESTVTVAETGHLVFATLHTNSAAQTVDRIIDVFPEGQQPQIRAQLSNVITAVISQRLIPVKSGGRRAIQEILVANTAVKNAIREGKTYQIDNVIQTSSEAGMQTMESALVKLVREGEITVQEAEENSVKVDELRALLKSNN